jgi:ribonuclease VapC
MIAVDTSALIAILAQEPEKASFVNVIESSETAVVSVASVLEVTMVWAGRQPDAPTNVPDKLLEALGITLVEVSEHQLTIARDAFHRFGKGRHSAGLNFGDCFAYALAASLKVPLLFKGDDFSQTDIRSAMPVQGAN